MHFLFLEFRYQHDTRETVTVLTSSLFHLSHVMLCLWICPLNNKHTNRILLKKHIMDSYISQDTEAGIPLRSPSQIKKRIMLQISNTPHSFDIQSLVKDTREAIMKVMDLMKIKTPFELVFRLKLQQFWEITDAALKASMSAGRSLI